MHQRIIANLGRYLLREPPALHRRELKIAFFSASIFLAHAVDAYLTNWRVPAECGTEVPRCSHFSRDVLARIGGYILIRAGGC